MLNEFRRQQASAHFEHGLRLERSGRFDEAMSEYKHAVEADPSYAVAHNALGMHYRRKGLLTKAIEEFHMAVNLAQDYESYFNMGKTLFDLGRHNEAREAFKHCLDLAPGDPEARYELACTNYGLGEYADALTDMHDLANQYPADWEFPYVVGSCYLRLGEYHEAEEEFRKAVSLAKNEEDTWSAGDALAVAQRHQEFELGKSLSLKERFYKDYGVAYLGTGHDDGLEIPEYFVYNFTYHDIAITLRRFLRLVEAFGWQFETLVSLDAESYPLALALGQLLGAPVKETDEIGDGEAGNGEFALLIFGIGRTPELFQVAMERLPETALSFGLCVSWLKQGEILPDIMGISTMEESSLPWRRVTPLSRQQTPADQQGGAIVLKPPYEDHREPGEIAEDIISALDELPDDQRLDDEVAYYTEKHSRLRFLQSDQGRN
jgi:tetratricopeptide (TPR) repeat protein